MKLWNQLFTAPEVASLPTEADKSKAKKEFSPIAEDASMHERWQIVLAGRQASECSVKELRELVDMGTPLRQRHILWPRWWGDSNRDEVETLQTQADAQCASQIELDLRRTLPEPCTDNQRNALRRVLCAYAASNPNIGYCQGMSYIAAVPLLLAFSEADAFMGLRYIVEEVCPDYHGSSLGGYFRDSAVLDALLSQLLPEVHIELVNLDIPFDMLATDHLLTVSARSWPLQAVTRLWDVVLMDGSPALLASFLALLQAYFPKALADSKAAHTRRNEISVDVASRFLELSRNCIAHDIDVVIQHTRKFIKLLVGDLASVGPCEKGVFLEKLRAQFSKTAAASDEKVSNMCGKRAGLEIIEDPTDLPQASEDSWDVMVEARITMGDGSVHLLRVGVIDQPRDVAKKFVQEHHLDKSCNAPLAAWLKKVENDAEQYPVKASGSLAQICDVQSTKK